jgi:farnesyl-diphosphate farnesyltransferase
VADLDDLLVKTSRTFALSIPPLPEPTRREVTVAYLLFRLIDTVEDASHWPQRRRVEALAAFRELLFNSSPDEAAELSRLWQDEEISAHAGYRELVAELPAVLAAHRALGPAVSGAIASHVSRCAEGMARFVSRTDASGQLRLSSLDELQRYCYVVAGIVGEMLTELFLLDAPQLDALAAEMRPRAATFGEGLQLVNVLKDAGDDAREGRRYLPEAVGAEAVFSLARRDLGVAGEYVHALQAAGAPRGFVEFTALPVRLAWATLEVVERHGPGAKLSRARVLGIRADLDRALRRGAPAVTTPTTTLQGGA